MGICKVDGCDNKEKARGYCSKHYSRLLRYGDTSYKKHHNMSGSQEYEAWHKMKQRCTNETDKAYKNYGGRGITVCDRWLDCFKNFYQDMGDKPFKKAQLDRINNDGNYEPGNCRWVTAAMNSRNRRSTKLNMIKAREIRKLYNHRTNNIYNLAPIFDVCPKSIHNIITNKTWREK